MATSTRVSGGYFPVYPQHGELPDPEIRSFITNFYRISDSPDSNELWVSYFLKDATVTMGNDTGTGEQGELLLTGFFGMNGQGRLSNTKHQQRFVSYEEECGMSSQRDDTLLIKCFPARFKKPKQPRMAQRSANVCCLAMCIL
jgi:hypothetical protein